MEKPNAQLGARINFLGTSVTAACEHRKVDNKTTRDRILVKEMNTDKKDLGVTVAEIAESIAGAIKRIADPEATAGKTDVPVIPWPAGVEKVVGAIKVYMDDIYLQVDKIGNDPVKVEYALGIGIKLDQEKREELSKLPPFNLVQLEDLYLKIWQTDNPGILKEMNIVDLDKALPAPG